MLKKVPVYRSTVAVTILLIWYSSGLVTLLVARCIPK